MDWPPIEPQLLTKSIWGDQQEERGEGDEESNRSIGVKGVPYGCGYARGGERPPCGERAEHHTCRADAA
jgi:hypothetical protein